MLVKKKYIKKEGRTKTGTKSEYRVFAWKPTQKAKLILSQFWYALSIYY